MKFRLIKKSFQTLITVPRRIWEKFRDEKSISGGDAARVGAVAGALAAALATGAPTVALAEEATTDTATTSEMTYEMSNDELAELTSYENPVVEQVMVEQTAPAAEQTTVEEAAPVVEQTTTEESAAEVTEKKEETTTEEAAPAAEQTTTEESAAEETSTEEVTEKKEEASTETRQYSAGKPTVDYGEVTKEETSTTVESGSSYDITETETTSRAAFTVVEKNGKIYVFTEAGEDELSQKMLSEQLEEWWNANYGASKTPTYVYSISSLGTGTKTIGEDGVVISIGSDGKVTILDEEVTRTEELDEKMESIETQTTQDPKEETSEIEKTQDSKETVSETESTAETMSVELADDDYIVITEKDGSITIGYKYILGAKEYGKILESLKLPEGTKINTPILLPTKSEEVAGGSLTSGSLTISTEDGLHYVITGEGASEVKTSKDTTGLLEEAHEQSETGHLDGDQGKIDHDEPKEPEPETPEPKDPEPKTPEPKNPEPKTPEPKNPEPETPGILPKTGDDFNKGLTNLMAGLGITMLGAGLLSKKLKLSKGGAKYALIEPNDLFIKNMAKQMLKNNAPTVAGRAM